MTDHTTLTIAARDAMIRELSGKLEAYRQLSDMQQQTIDGLMADLKRAEKGAPVAVPEGLTERHRDVIRMALLSFHSRAMRQAEAAAQDKGSMWSSAGDVDLFLSDAKTAEEARALLAAAPQEKGHE